MDFGEDPQCSKPVWQTQCLLVLMPPGPALNDPPHLAASGGRHENCQTNSLSLSPELCEEMHPSGMYSRLKVHEHAEFTLKV